MSTRIITHNLGPDGPVTVDVEEDFDTVFGRIAPVTPPSSSLEARNNIVYTDLAGNRVIIPVQAVALVRENAEALDEVS